MACLLTSSKPTILDRREPELALQSADKMVADMSDAEQGRDRVHSYRPLAARHPAACASASSQNQRSPLAFGDLRAPIPR